jgi:beta-mannosidase
MDRQRDSIFIAELWQGDQRVDLRVATFVPTKHLSLSDPAVTISLSRVGRTLFIDLEAQSLARLVELTLEGSDVVFSDNYFDLPAGRVISVSCPLPDGWSLAQAQAALKTRSVYDSYAQPVMA